MNEENWNKTAGAQSRAGEDETNLTDVLWADAELKAVRVDVEVRLDF